MVRWSAIVGLVVLSASPACKNKEPPAPPAAPAGVPASVTSILSLRHPQQAADRLLAQLGKLTALPVSSATLFGWLWRSTGLPAELIDVVDRRRPWHMINLDPRRLKQSNPAVIVLPIRSREALIDALQRRMKRIDAEDELLTFRQRGAAAGAADLLVAPGTRHVVLPSGRRAYRQTRAFIETTLLRRPPEHDVVLRLLLSNLDGGDPQRVQQQIDRTVQRLRQRLRQQGRIVDAASERTVRRLAALLGSADELRVTADLAPAQLVLALRARGRGTGRLATLIKRQRPGEPVGQALLPGHAWLVLADRGNPGAQHERGWLVSTFETMVEGPEGAAIREAARYLASSLDGDLTLVLHRPGDGGDGDGGDGDVDRAGDVDHAGDRGDGGDGNLDRAADGDRQGPGGAGGLALAAVAESLDADSSRRALAALVERLGKWLAAQARQRGERDQITAERQVITTDDAAGEIYHFGIDRAARGSTVARFFGRRPSFGWAVTQDKVLVVAGRDGAAELQRMLAAAAGQPRRQSLARDRAFGRARVGDGRVGLLYFSPIDLLRSWPPQELGALRAQVAALSSIEVRRAPHLSWGIDADRSAFDLTLRLPFEHLLQLKSVLRALAERPLPVLRPPRR